MALTGPYSGPRVQSNGFGGYNSGYPSIDWATFLANAGGTSISHIYLDVDGGWLSTQVVDVAKLDVNGTDYTAPTPTPEPGTLLMLGSGVVGLIGVARRKLKV